MPRSRPGRPRDAALADRRRSEILSVASSVFAADGYERADVQRIADLAHLGKGTVYRYFPTKQALFLATVERGLEGLRAAVDAVFSRPGDPVDRMEAAMTAYLRYFAAHPELTELFLQEHAAFRGRTTPLYFARRAEKHAELDAFTAELVRGGRLRPLRPRQLLDAVGDLLYGTVVANHLSRRPAEPRRQARDVVDLVFHGILSEAERRRRARGARR